MYGLPFFFEKPCQALNAIEIPPHLSFIFCGALPASYCMIVLTKPKSLLQSLQNQEVRPLKCRPAVATIALVVEWPLDP